MTDAGIKRAIVAAAWLVVASAGMLLLPTINTYFVHPAVLRIGLVELVLILLIGSFALHLQGYAHIARRIDSVFLRISVYALIVTVILYGCVLALVEYLNPYQGTLLQNALMGLFVIFYGLAAVLFGIALLLERKRLGWIAMIGWLITLVPIYIFIPWVGLFLPLLSCYALLRMEKNL